MISNKKLRYRLIATTPLADVFSKLLGRESCVSLRPSVRGTPLYMAPEMTQLGARYRACTRTTECIWHFSPSIELHSQRMTDWTWAARHRNKWYSWSILHTTQSDMFAVGLIMIEIFSDFQDEPAGNASYFLNLLHKIIFPKSYAIYFLNLWQCRLIIFPNSACSLVQKNTGSMI